MIKQFNEIEEFFMRDQFSEIELEEFKSKLKNQYLDKIILNQALTLISMKLLYFSLLNDSVATELEDENQFEEKVKKRTSINSLATKAKKIGE